LAARQAQFHRQRIENRLDGLAIGLVAKLTLSGIKNRIKDDPSRLALFGKEPEEDRMVVAPRTDVQG
jgi:hypothetical protein